MHKWHGTYFEFYIDTTIRAEKLRKNESGITCHFLTRERILSVVMSMP